MTAAIAITAHPTYQFLLSQSVGVFIQLQQLLSALDNRFDVLLHFLVLRDDVFWEFVVLQQHLHSALPVQLAVFVQQSHLLQDRRRHRSYRDKRNPTTNTSRAFRHFEDHVKHECIM